ncbi:MAG: hypothetical protein IID53_05550, partial [Proteobacteria bacterium]|nr:hypothetical protein [Pseudomonadota bacterium]
MSEIAGLAKDEPAHAGDVPDSATGLPGRGADAPTPAVNGSGPAGDLAEQDYMAELGYMAEPGPDLLTTVNLNNRYEIMPGAPIEKLDSPTASAFMARDRVLGYDDLFALVCDTDVVARRDVLPKIRDLMGGAMLRLMDWGIVEWPKDGQRHFAIIYEQPVGDVLMTDLDGEFGPMDELELTRVFLPSVISALGQLSANRIIHRAIRPDNIFYTDESRQGVVLGENASAPAGYNQPVMFETIEFAMAMPEGRGPGTTADDIYALGVTMLMLLLGHNPVADIDDHDLIAAKIKEGSYRTLLGGKQVVPPMREPLRGMLSDDPAKRWGLEDLEMWLNGRRLSLMQPAIAERAQRPFHFEGKMYYCCRSLAHGLARDWRSASLMVKQGNIARWVRRSIGDEERAKAIDAALGMAKDSRGVAKDSRGPLKGPSASIALVSRVCMALDPAAPIRYKGFSSTFGGLEQAMAATFQHHDRAQIFAEMILHDLPIFWLQLQKMTAADVAAKTRSFERLAEYLRNPRLGFGIERCLYAFNPTQHCLSPFIEADQVVEISELLPALDRVGGSRPEVVPIDRHIAAFIGARFKDNVDKPLTEFTIQNNQARSALGLLNVLALVQWRLGPPELPGLANWVGEHLTPVIASFHN